MDICRQQRRVYSAAQFAEDHIENVPVFILACIQASPGITNWGS